MAEAYDVHIGFPPPARWSEISDDDVRRNRFLGGTGLRPTIASEQIDWPAVGLTARWIGEDSSAAVAAIEPNAMVNRGGDDWDRFIAGARLRGEPVLAVSMMGHPRPDGDVNFRGVFGGPTESVSLPGATAGSAAVGGARAPLAVPPTIQDDLGPADRDLALRLVNSHGSVPSWWALSRGTAEWHSAGGGVQVIDPDGSLKPLLVTGAGEVVAAVWISPDEQIRHYIIPWLPSWQPMLSWLAQTAIPEFVPSAARRLHANLGQDPALQTDAEVAALAERSELDDHYRVRSAEIEQALGEARFAADQVRLDMLYGRGAPLEKAVSTVLTDAGITATPLDKELRKTASADLLVAYQRRRRLVEVKSEAGNASERLVTDSRKHLDTWPALRPDVDVEGVTLVINHQIKTYPTDRARNAYSRPEFVQTLAIPVVTTMVLFDAWRRSDFAAIRTAVFGDDPLESDGAAGVDELAPVVDASTRSRWSWRRKHD